MNNLYAFGRNARPVAAPGFRAAEEVELAPDQIVFAALIGRLPMYFDFFVYAIASALVFPRLFFPMVGRPAGLVLSFAVLGVAFIVRPLGVRLFARLERRFGRAAKLGAAAFALCVCAGAIGLMGGYAALGPAAIGLLILFRAGQGLGLAGLGEGLVALPSLGSDKAGGWWALAPKLAAPLGLLLAGGLFAYGASGLSQDDFVAWGWRFPFLMAAGVNLVALLARLRLGPAERIAGFTRRTGRRL